MRILLSGYVLGEGRMSMVRFGRTLRGHLAAILDKNDRVTLDERSNELPGTPMQRQGLAVKLEKRLGVPLRLRLKQYDVLHIVDSDYAAAIPSSRLARTVVTCHDMMPFLQREHGLPDTFSKFGRRFFEQNLRKMGECGIVAADSEFTRDCILKHTDCLEERIAVVPLAVDHDRFRPIPRDSAQVTAFHRAHKLEGKDVMLHVGAGAWYKNVESVLEVLHELVRQGKSNLALLKVGRLSEDQMELAARLNVQDRIIFLERISDDEMPVVYAAAGVLLWPSLCEGFGFPVLEAMACGTPVVCSNGGSLAEVAGTAAATHEPRDIEGLAASCRRVLEDESVAEAMRAAGLEHSAGFHWNNTAAAYYKLYRRIREGLT